MGNLTFTAYYTRKTINYTIIGLIAFIILKILWTIFINAWVAAHPPPPPPPNHYFGTLPYPNLPKEGLNRSFSYKLETVTGGLPESSPSARVYYMPVLSGNFLNLDRATEKAKTMGFTGDWIKLSNEEYLWSDPQFPLRTLKINTVSGNISLRYDYREDQSLLSQKNLPVGDEAISEAKEILKNYDLLPDELMSGDIKIVNLKMQGGMLIQVESLSDADFVKVAFNRGLLDGNKVLTPGDSESVVSVILSGSEDSTKRVVELNYNYQKINTDNFATYPLKTGDLAWEELKNGKGYIANFADPSEKNKVIRNIYLAYYDSLKIQTYLEPIFVFEGDKSFKAYLPAITDQWLESPPK